MKSVVLSCLISVVFATISVSLSAQLSLYPYRKGNLWGYCDENKKIIVEPAYNITYPHSGGMGLVINYDATQKKYLYGFIDQNGKVIVKPQFGSATFFVKGRAVVRNVAGKSGVIDIRGKFIIEPVYTKILFLEKSQLFKVTNDKNKVALFDVTGKKLFDFRFDDIDDASSQFHAILNTGSNGKQYCTWIDRSGKEIPVKLGGTEEFREGLAAAKDMTTGKYGYVNTKGQWVIQPQYWMAKPFDGGIALVANSQENTKWFYLNSKGDTILNKAGYTNADPFEDGLALIDGKFINKDGSAFMPEYNFCFAFHGGFAEVRTVSNGRTSEWALIDRSGRVIATTPYSGGFARGDTGLIIKKDGLKCGLIDRTGKTIIDLKYDRLMYKNGKICLYYQDRNYNEIITGYITETGVECWDN